MSGEKSYKVYCHTNKINGKRYIGVTSKSLYGRSKANGRGYSNSKYFANAIEKYGWESFSHEILKDNLTKDDASVWERYYIHLYETQDGDKGYNIQGGGINAGGMSEEGKRRMGLAHSGPNSPLAIPIVSFDLDGNRLMDFPYIKAATEYYGIPDSSIGASLYSPNKTCHGMLFRYASDVVGVTKLSDEYLASVVRVRNYQCGKHAKCTSVVAFDSDGNCSFEFDSMKKAALHFGVYHGCISGAVRGRIKSVCGYYLRLKSDVGDAKRIDVTCIYSKKNICVVQLSQSGEVIKRFKSLREAERCVGGDHKRIKRSAELGVPYRGFLWSFE